VQKGHSVTMITSGLANNEFAVPQGRKYAKYETEGINVVAISAGYNNPQLGTGISGWRRMLKFYQFARLAAHVGRKLSKPDVVFATHTPLPIGLAGATLARHFNVPFVFEVRDLWPDALINLGGLKNPLVIWHLRQMAKKIYNQATHIVALSPGMKNGIVHTGVEASRVTVIPNACDCNLFRLDLDGSIWRNRLGLDGRFTAVYFGAMGLANGLEYVIEAARILSQRHKENIALVLVGDGGKKPELQRLAQEYKLTNVIFNSSVPKAELAGLVAECDVCMTIFSAAKENTWSPNKMFDALAAGKAVLINVPGWLRETIESHNCGRYLDPHRPQALADALEELAANPQLCREMGKNARALAEREFERTKLAERLENVLLQVTKNHG
jgi:glycosyltransferase involved in cell wall biosynthesis